MNPGWFITEPYHVFEHISLVSLSWNLNLPKGSVLGIKVKCLLFSDSVSYSEPHSHLVAVYFNSDFLNWFFPTFWLLSLVIVAGEWKIMCLLHWYLQILLILLIELFLLLPLGECSTCSAVIAHSNSDWFFFQNSYSGGTLKYFIRFLVSDMVS